MIKNGNMNPNLPILVAIPFFLVFIGLELYFAKRKNQTWYRLNDAITNLNIGIGNQVFSLFIKGILLWSYGHLFHRFAFFRLEFTWYNFLLCLLLFDFLFYWAHRWSHEMNFLWGAHIVHHQSEDYNLSVALRQSWIHNLIAFFIFLPIPLLGFVPDVFILAASIHTLYQFWIHTKAIKKLPWWIESWLNTPSHHRVHHGINPQYIDKNHGGVLIIWDRLFGTFQEEGEEVRYGISKKYESWNPAWANLHYYVEMLEKMRQAPTLWLKLKTLWARPGWDPKTNHEPPYQVDLNRSLYDANTPSKSLKRYVIFQFCLSIIALCAFMYFFQELSNFFKVTNALLILITGVLMGMIFENKKWIFPIELLRLFVVVVNLNTMYYLHFPHWFQEMLVGSILVGLLTLLWLYRGKRQISMHLQV